MIKQETKDLAVDKKSFQFIFKCKKVNFNMSLKNGAAMPKALINKLSAQHFFNKLGSYMWCRAFSDCVMETKVTPLLHYSRVFTP